MTNERRDKILRNFTFGDLDKELTLMSIRDALEEADKCQK
jgi:hypothetical protein